MLGGQDPLLIFTTKKRFFTGSRAGLLSGLGSPTIAKASKYIPLAVIPLYLRGGEDFVINPPQRNVNIEVDPISSGEAGGGETYEKSLGEEVSVVIKARDDSVIITALLALLSSVEKLVDTSEYQISLFFDDVILLDASLRHYSTQKYEGSNIREVTFSLISRPAPVKALGDQSAQTLTNVVGNASKPL